jgi:hypothetical protein
MHLVLSEHGNLPVHAMGDWELLIKSHLLLPAPHLASILRLTKLVHVQEQSFAHLAYHLIRPLTLFQFADVA